MTKKPLKVLVFQENYFGIFSCPEFSFKKRKQKLRDEAFKKYQRKKKEGKIEKQRSKMNDIKFTFVCFFFSEFIQKIQHKENRKNQEKSD